MTAICSSQADVGRITRISVRGHLVIEGVQPDYARKLMRIKSPVTFDRYTRRAVEKKAEDAFNDLIERSDSEDGLF